MKSLTRDLKEEVKAFCALIGADPLLVQGAGGNVSWKDGEVLWIKGSGTWLADAQEKDIFIPLNLAHLRLAISNQNFSATPENASGSTLRPSIETMLHALMRHPVVVHLHAVEILAHLVRRNPEEELGKAIGGFVQWIFVDYFKPGAALAEAVSSHLARSPDVEVIFLGSHGVVVGAKDVGRIEDILSQLICALACRPPSRSRSLPATVAAPELAARGYGPCKDQELHLLATDHTLSSRLRHEWALYPDHVVFLGEKSCVLGGPEDLRALTGMRGTRPTFIFYSGQGVFESKSATMAQRAQLRCYYEILVRQEPTQRLSVLTKDEIGELINWDAEQFRLGTDTRIDSCTS